MQRRSALWLAHLRRTPLLLFIVLYTIATGGPFLWVAAMFVDGGRRSRGASLVSS